MTAPAPLVLAPSILAADFARLADEVADVEPAVAWLHVDVMDGHYVDNLTVGPPVVASLRPSTALYLDVHVMIDDPDSYAPRFVAAGADSVCFHPEVARDPAAVIGRIHALGADAGVAVRPGQPLASVEALLTDVELLLLMTVEPGWGGQAFMPEVVPKIEQARAWRDDHGGRFRIQVDGGITTDTVAAAAAAGADTFVAGSAVFGQPDRVAAASAILDAARAARAARVTV